MRTICQYTQEDDLKTFNIKIKIGIFVPTTCKFELASRASVDIDESSNYPQLINHAIPKILTGIIEDDF